MFSKFFPFQNKITTSMPSKNEPEICEARVHVWSGGFFNGLGHVAISFQSNEKNPNAPVDYWSIWPKSIPAGGLTSIFPLDAIRSPQLENDYYQEARRPPADFADLMEPIEFVPIPPDREFVIQLDEKKIREELTRLDLGIKEGTVAYQLIPAVKTGPFLQWLMPKKYNETYNCVTLTQHLLKKGGIEGIQVNSWMTPSKFADNLQEQISITQESSVASKYE
ncbi:Uncharacterised protein [Legionella wadsworthii]|uniref:Uncharacterized protein n=1 Tax=Legionella wadsworthii TaxID=28088 RepID=A0A378LSL5_9GAMM|nr:hypothetical protein [Legionella wadsworthii]STY29687.1 Uncharacterised protein [Legionella wadsworthii]